jgi:hypothetical protein
MLRVPASMLSRRKSPLIKGVIFHPCYFTRMAFFGLAFEPSAIMKYTPGP